MTQELILTDQTYMPAMSIAQAAQRFNTLVEFVQTVMRPEVDYGTIPGTPKPTLLKPGAEKLTTLFGLTTRFVVVEKIEDWTGEAHAGEPFFYYWYRCQLWRGDRLIAEADGSCNSREGKYRWRTADRKCPNCDAAAIKRSKYPPRGAAKGTEPGWYCYAKMGGCGAEFSADDTAITGQQGGRIPNPDIADQVNTLQKMAQKRALIAATLIGVNASEFFTQDVEDLQTVGNGSSYVPPMQVVNAGTGELFNAPPTPRTNPAEQNPRRAAFLVRIHALIDEAQAMGVTLPNGSTLASKTEDELIAIGKDYRARLDKIKQDLAGKRAAPDLQAEYDEIDAS